MYEQGVPSLSDNTKSNIYTSPLDDRNPTIFHDEDLKDSNWYHMMKQSCSPKCYYHSLLLESHGSKDDFFKRHSQRVNDPKKLKKEGGGKTTGGKTT